MLRLELFTVSWSCGMLWDRVASHVVRRGGTGKTNALTRQDHVQRWEAGHVNNRFPLSPF